MHENTTARHILDWWLREQLRKARRVAIAKYAAEVAGTSVDLDAELESAAVEHLVKTEGLCAPSKRA